MKLAPLALVFALGLLSQASADEAPASRPASRPTSRPGEAFRDRYAGAVEERHGIAAWRKKSAFRCKLKLDLGGKTIIDGTLLMETKGVRTRIDLNDGTSFGFDGKEAWVSPKGAEFKRARFHALTWSYFVAAPFKLRDPGSRLKSEGNLLLRGRPYVAAKLSFAPGVGDAPDDWYIAYRHPKVGRLACLAYIVTYGKDRAKAEKEPHAITYGDYEKLDGVLISKSWRFWKWSRERGPHGRPLGYAKLSDPAFLEPRPESFKRPDDARIAPLARTNSGARALTGELALEASAIALSRQSKAGDYGLISSAELEEALSKKAKMVLIDALPKRSFEAGHLPGALNFQAPKGEAKAWSEGFGGSKEAYQKLLGADRGALVVVYCGHVKCERSHNGAAWARRLGFSNVRRYPGGLRAWKQAGHKLVK